MNIHTEIQPLIKNIQPLTLETYIDNSTMKEKNKKYFKNLFKKYIEYCNNKYITNEISINNRCPLDTNINIYDPSNIVQFIKEKCSYQRTSLKKILDVFLRALKKCTKNENLEYPESLGKPMKSFNKHFIKYEELRNFMNYLKQKEDYQMCLIFELLYKFGVRVGAIAKVKVKDINKEGIITFKEKNQKIIIRKLTDTLLLKINYLISIYKLKENDFLFYNNYKTKSNEQRSNYFSLKLNRVIKESNCFTKEEGEIICAHMFRSTHEIEIFQKNGLLKAAKEIGHSKIVTTRNNYLKPDEDNLYLKEGETRFNNSQYNDIFQYSPSKNVVLKGKKRKSTYQNNCKRKNNIKDSFEEKEISFSESDSDYIADSLYDNIFDYNMIPNLNSFDNDNKIPFYEQLKDNSPDNVPIINFDNKEETILYNNFLLENKITTNELSTINIPFASSLDILKFKTELNDYFKNNPNNDNLVPKKEKVDINNIKYCHTFKGISFYTINTLISINEFISNEEKYYPNIIRFSNNKNNKEVVSNIIIEPNTFICEAMGYYGYRKSEKIINANKIITKILLFKCKDNNYNRYFYLLKDNNFCNILLSNDNKIESNIQLIQYLDIDMTVKVGMISTKKINIGDKFILI